MKLYLIRHGETEANEKHIYCGSTDLPLMERGIVKLRELSYRVPEGCRFITSGMQRTEETLYYLFGEQEHEQEPRFREIDFGIFEMHSYEELKDTEAYQLWLTGDNEKNVPPEGESGETMSRRVLEALQEVMAEQKDTVVITHGGVIAAIMAHCFPEENRSRFAWQPAPGHGYLLTGDGYQALP